MRLSERDYSPYRNRTRPQGPPSTTGRSRAEAACAGQEESPHQNWFVGTLVLDFPASRAGRNKCPLLRPLSLEFYYSSSSWLDTYIKKKIFLWDYLSHTDNNCREANPQWVEKTLPISKYFFNLPLAWTLLIYWQPQSSIEQRYLLLLLSNCEMGNQLCFPLWIGFWKS